MRKTALITGATGFIGSQLARSLYEMGRPVRCVVRHSSDRSYLNSLDVELVEVDLCDKAQVKQQLRDVDTVYHVAGLVAGNAADLYRTNVHCTESLAEACATMPTPPRFIHISSLAAAGPSQPDRPRSTTDPCTPVSAYGKSKLASEYAVAKVSGDLPATIVRPGIVYGPYDRQFAQLLNVIKTFRCNPLVGFHDPPLAMLHVHDFIRFLLRAEKKATCIDSLDAYQYDQSDSGIYFASHWQPTSLGKLGRIVRSYINRPRAWTLPIPISVARPAARISELFSRSAGRPTLFNVDKIREASQLAWTCDVSKSAAELNWFPYYSAEDGFRHTVDWYYDNQWL